MNTNGPAVFLTKLEHQIVTKRLNEVLRAVEKGLPPKDAKKMILEIYSGFPQWHRAVDEVFGI